MFDPQKTMFQTDRQIQGPTSASAGNNDFENISNIDNANSLYL